jgi:hypothetical protein
MQINAAKVAGHFNFEDLEIATKTTGYAIAEIL